jgi:sterol desaturase/sphingolipid hydroxylase (fatty acid hydroxylase superfamily)
MSRYSSSSSSSGGITFTGLLTILFIGLKLTGHINWPWIWVLSPIWISLLIFLAIIAAFVGIYLIAYLKK